MTSPSGRFVTTLVRERHARRVLEIGSGTGRRSVRIARALPAEGLLITIEARSGCAQLARRLVARHGCASQVSLIVGDPARYLHKLAGPFDIVVQTASQATAPGTLHERLMKLLAPDGLLVTSNLGAADRYNEVLAADARLITRIIDVAGGVAISERRTPHDP
jgi:predicted O-methyltransferase YrrM